MNPQKTSAKDFFLNLGSIVALYTVAVSLLSLLFTVINNAYPQTTNPYYAYSGSISWPVATIIIFFPVFVLLMWLLEKSYVVEPEKRNLAVKRWLTYITLFIAGLAMAVDLVTVLYYFLDGQDLTAAFLLKVFVVLVVTALVFMYYITEIRGRLTSSSRKIWVGVSAVIIILSISWGFYVIGSPATQRLIKYDMQKVNDLQSINNEITSYYYTKNALPQKLSDLANGNYFIPATDPQSQTPYEYVKTGSTTYNLCATFNKSSKDITSPDMYARPYGYQSWVHPKGQYCFNLSVTSNQNPKGAPSPLPPVPIR